LNPCGYYMYRLLSHTKTLQDKRDIFFLFRIPFILHIVTLWSVNIDWVWIGNHTYWTLILVNTSNYDSLTELHTPNISVTIKMVKVSL
jgi:hypothetical protein